jgi:hypothetical protein
MNRRITEEYDEEINDVLVMPQEVQQENMYPSLANHDINIRQVHNGFIVSAGCQTFVFEKFEIASRYMTMYFQDPEGTEKKHRDGTLFSK